MWKPRFGIWAQGGTGLILAFALGGAASAQATLFESSAVTEACRDERCPIEIDRVLADLRSRNLQDEDFNSQIGFLAAILLESAETAGPATLPMIGAALARLGQSSTDARQGAAIADVAEAVAQGRAGEVGAAAPYAASPSGPPIFNRPPPPFQSGPGPGRNRSRWSDFWRR